MRTRAVLKTIPILIAAVILISPGCVITPDGVEEKEVILQEVFPPDKTVASYRQVEKPRAATSETLASQLGHEGKVDVLKKWGAFTSMVCEYGLPDRPPKARVTVTEMTTKFKAYGAYTNLRPGLLPKQQYVKIGTSATIDEIRLIFVQDRYVVLIRDLSDAPEDQRRAMLINFAKKISDRIPRAVTDIDPVSFLPYTYRVPASERLDMEDPLGLDIFKTGAVTALYRFEDRECKIFLCQLQVQTGKKKALEELSAELKKNGEVIEFNIGDQGYEGKLFGKRCMVAQRKDVVFGAFGTMTDQEMRQMLATVDRRIKPFMPQAYKEKEKESEGDKKKDELYE